MSATKSRSRPPVPQKAQLSIAQCPRAELALTNYVFITKEDASLLAPPDEPTYVMLNGYVFFAQVNAAIAPGGIALNNIQRRLTKTSTGEAVQVETYIPSVGLTSMSLELDLNVKTRGAQISVDHDAVVTLFLTKFKHHVFCVGQEIVIEFQGTNLIAKVTAVDDSLVLAGPGSAGTAGKTGHGMLLADTEIDVAKSPNSGVKVTGQRKGAAQGGFKLNWDFESMGIGGLDKEFGDIFRRAFVSRTFPPVVIKKLGINHVRGMLLYGAPGTGKTLIARQIGKMLNGKEPKVVNGPEILNKYVGASEENIRNLFKDAETDMKMNGEESELHIIIFDEIDAICKSRGSQRDGTGVHDTVVNQLLSKIDGVEALNNILVIGMTNRKDMIDEALMRPGRLEVHMEIGLPDEAGRVQILRIHTAKMRQADYLDRDVNLEELAQVTKNFSGAEIEGLVKSAASFALQRKVDVTNVKGHTDAEHISVCRADFMQALVEVRPAYGVETNELETRLIYGLISYGPKFDHIRHSLRMFTQQLKSSERTPVLSVLLEGAAGTGKTALAAKAAIESEFPFVKMVSPENMVGYSELSKCNLMNRVFDDANKSPYSVVVLDNIERLLEYVSIGPRFSNLVLQSLLVLIKRIPQKGKKLLIIGTTSCPGVLETMELLSAFNIVLHVPSLGPSECRMVLSELGCIRGSDLERTVASLAGFEVGIKKLMLVVEMARAQGSDYIAYDQFLASVHDCGL